MSCDASRASTPHRSRAVGTPAREQRVCRLVILVLRDECAAKGTDEDVTFKMIQQNDSALRVVFGRADRRLPLVQKLNALVLLGQRR